MAKIRKMLGSSTDPEILALMHQIESQSRTTLTFWAQDQVYKGCLPILQKRADHWEVYAELIQSIRALLQGQEDRKKRKDLLKQAREQAKSILDPSAQAAARSIATACSVWDTPTGALGFVFYYAAAVVYHEHGTALSASCQDQLAAKEFHHLLKELKQISISEEPHPVSLSWYCKQKP